MNWPLKKVLICPNLWDKAQNQNRKPTMNIMNIFGVCISNYSCCGYRWIWDEFYWNHFHNCGFSFIAVIWTCVPACMRGKLLDKPWNVSKHFDRFEFYELWKQDRKTSSVTFYTFLFSWKISRKKLNYFLGRLTINQFIQINEHTMEHVRIETKLLRRELNWIMYLIKMSSFRFWILIWCNCPEYLKSIKTP